MKKAGGRTSRDIVPLRIPVNLTTKYLFAVFIPLNETTQLNAQ
jgi:hypothetical protein